MEKNNGTKVRSEPTTFEYWHNQRIIQTNVRFPVLLASLKFLHRFHGNHMSIPLSIVMLNTLTGSHLITLRKIIRMKMNRHFHQN